MLVLNEWYARGGEDANATSAILPQNDATRKVREGRANELNAVNVAFLRSLGCVVKNRHGERHFKYSDEIRIPIQQQDLYTLPCESFLYIEGKFATRESAKEDTAKEGTAKEVTRAKLVNNCVAFMFDEIRYELNGVEIDKSRNVGITTLMKNYASLSYERDRVLQNTGWEIPPIALDDFNFCVPLNVLLGFCEDYKRIVINARHELILIRAHNDNNCVVAHSNQRPKITLLRIQWRMPHMKLNDKLSLLRTLDSGRYLSMGFRSWDLYEFPLLQSTTKHSWAVKAATQLKKPRYVIFALQTGRKNVPSEDVSKFNDCKLTNVKLYLNSEFYPYDEYESRF
ncbi:uncharacterized protein LOC105424084 [Pogonomyrmex barbatus]|uniref:Uncharacterized protein LOC105424084 n=1 Tax=Pogonomyrmex barbatus TaxID=144034 RepID=A0A6I9VYX9_9HYME|nr:uncharacterized protein LOC105424084 [Pogonomyrmex barbatus]